MQYVTIHKSFSDNSVTKYRNEYKNNTKIIQKSFMKGGGGSWGLRIRDFQPCQLYINYNYYLSIAALAEFTAGFPILVRRFRGSAVF